MKCNQVDCNNVATHRVFWPGTPPLATCKEHSEVMLWEYTSMSRRFLMTQAEKIKAIAKILKGKFTNLTIEETIDIAFRILETIEEIEDE